MEELEELRADAVAAVDYEGLDLGDDDLDGLGEGAGGGSEDCAGEVGEGLFALGVAFVFEEGEVVRELGGGRGGGCGYGLGGYGDGWDWC